MDTIRYERELYEPVRDYLILQGFTVRAEVGSCDVVAAREDRLIVVELKRHLSLSPEVPGGVRRAPKKRTAIAKELHNRRTDGNVGGTRGVPLLTAYREAALKLAVLIDTYGPMKPKELREKGGHEKKTVSILNANFYRWFERMEGGRYALTEQGKAALLTYEQTAAVFRADGEKPAADDVEMIDYKATTGEAATTEEGESPLI